MLFYKRLLKRKLTESLIFTFFILLKHQTLFCNSYQKNSPILDETVLLVQTAYRESFKKSLPYNTFWSVGRGLWWNYKSWSLSTPNCNVFFDAQFPFSAIHRFLTKMNIRKAFSAVFIMFWPMWFYRVRKYEWNKSNMLNELMNYKLRFNSEELTQLSMNQNSYLLFII